MGSTLHTCIRCEKPKPLTKFYKDGEYNGVIRYRSVCKECYKNDRIINDRINNQRKRQEFMKALRGDK